MSNEYNSGTVYLSFVSGTTVFTIRRWYEDEPEQSLSRGELGSLVDSLQAIGYEDLKRRLPDAD